MLCLERQEAKIKRMAELLAEIIVLAVGELPVDIQQKVKEGILIGDGRGAEEKS